MNCKKCIHNMVCPHLKNEDAERCEAYADKDEWMRIKRYKGVDAKSARKTIGQIIREKRKAKGWIREQLANKIDTNKNTIASWEHGVSFPNAIFLVSMAEAFECTVDEILGME